MRKDISHNHHSEDIIMTWVHVHRMLQIFLDIFSYSLIAFFKKNTWQFLLVWSGSSDSLEQGGSGQLL